MEPRPNNYYVYPPLAFIDVSTPKWPRAIAVIDADMIGAIFPGPRWAAWSATGTTIYVRRSISRRLKQYLHRVIVPTELTVDHRNGDGLDNRRENLRPATDKQQMRNRPKIPGSTSRYKGVFRAPTGRWTAQIKYDHKSRHIGMFATEEAAARAYDEAARRAFGEFARTNFAEAK